MAAPKDAKKTYGHKSCEMPKKPVKNVQSGDKIQHKPKKSY